MIAGMETNAILDEVACWQAVVARDARLDGIFVYAVRSTGIFCRPGCRSRAPKHENVLFFRGAQEALEAGFRPCKRCRPQQVLPPDEREALIAGARELIEQAKVPLTLAELGKALNVSPWHLQRLFKAATGLTPRAYAAALRLERLKDGLRRGQPFTETIYNAGFGSPSRVYESGGGLGMTPGAYRHGGRGMNIVYTIVESPLGRMLVAATQRGVCMVSFGDQDAPLEQALRAEYFATQIAFVPADQPPLSDYAAALLRHLEGFPRLELPLDVRATAFQLRVWEELRRIPYGQTRTYTQVAEAIGKPRAVRAVASACASNPAAVVTPCHRVLRRDGSLGGYRWGLSRKAKLLEKELSS